MESVEEKKVIYQVQMHGRKQSYAVAKHRQSHYSSEPATWGPLLPGVTLLMLMLMQTPSWHSTVQPQIPGLKLPSCFIL